MGRSLEQLDDEELLALTGRDAEAFGVFYERHERTIAVYCVRRTGDREMVADVTAETFAVALRSAARFKAGGPPAVAWLIGIARNVLRDSHRRGRVQDATRRRLGMQPVDFSEASLERIDALLDDGLAQEHWRRLLESLPEDQRAAVRARVIDERDYGDIAGQLQTSEAVVRQRVSRGLRALRRASKETS
jgi:RNA polymerase sigma-70 factor (ECF subfamily)